VYPISFEFKEKIFAYIYAAAEFISFKVTDFYNDFNKKFNYNYSFPLSPSDCYVL